MRGVLFATAVRAMSKRTVTEKLDHLLNPLGFTRRNTAWNRTSGCVVEVMDVQVSKAGDTVTINAGVLDTEAHVILWENEQPEFVEVPTCTVSARIGELIGDTDIWWQLSDDEVADNVCGAVTDHALPFVQRMRSRVAMVQWLTDTRVVKRRYPPEIINLAILQHFLGRSSEACALLAEVEKRAIGAWCARVAEVAERLDCAK